MNRNKNLSIKILGVLREKNLTQKDLAEKIGITQAALSKILSGKFLTKVSTVQKIANSLNVPVGYLMDDNQEKNLENNNIILELLKSQNSILNEINEKIDLEIKLLKKINKNR